MSIPMLENYRAPTLFPFVAPQRQKKQPSTNGESFGGLLSDPSRRTSGQRTLQPAAPSFQGADIPTLPRSVSFVGADPLSPLRERDETALASLFDCKTMPEMEADIDQQLLRLLPEPCWEENAFEFLKEFL